jgi:hypothetical protein
MAALAGIEASTGRRRPARRTIIVKTLALTVATVVLGSSLSATGSPVAAVIATAAMCAAQLTISLETSWPPISGRSRQQGAHAPTHPSRTAIPES